MLLYAISLLLTIVIVRFIGAEHPSQVMEAFIAYNTREYHDSAGASPKQVGKRRPGEDSIFLAELSGQEHAVSYNLHDTLETLKTLVGKLYSKKYDVVSVERTGQFSFDGVTLKNRDTGILVRISKVSILADSLNPFIISRVIFTGVEEVDSSKT